MRSTGCEPQSFIHTAGTRRVQKFRILQRPLC